MPDSGVFMRDEWALRSDTILNQHIVPANSWQSFHILSKSFIQKPPNDPPHWWGDTLQLVVICEKEYDLDFVKRIWYSNIQMIWNCSFWRNLAFFRLRTYQRSRLRTFSFERRFLDPSIVHSQSRRCRVRRIDRGFHRRIWQDCQELAGTICWFKMVNVGCTRPWSQVV